MNALSFGVKKMAARKRVLKNSVAGALETFQSVNDVLVSPLNLSEREMVFFESITQSRELSTWSKVDLYNAATLAKVQRRIEEMNNQLDLEGCTLVNERGTQISNPAFSSLTQLMSQSAMLNRLLGISSSQRGLAAAPQKKRNEADAHARAIIEKASGEDLLA
jgi:hypothetical protein